MPQLVCVIEDLLGLPKDSVIKLPPASVRATGDMGSIPESGRSPAGGSGNSGILAGRIPWTEEPGKLQSMKSQRVGSD